MANQRTPLRFLSELPVQRRRKRCENTRPITTRTITTNMLRDKVTQLVYPALRYQLIAHSSKIARATDNQTKKRKPRIVEYSESAAIITKQNGYHRAMSNTIPEASTDKNGNVITRWIRSMNNKRYRTAIPSTLIEDEEEMYSNAAPSNEPETIELLGVLHPKNDYNHEGSVAQRIRTIAAEDLTIIQRITEAARNSPDEREYWLDKFHLSKNLRAISSYGDKPRYLIDHDPEAIQRELREFRIALTVNEVLRTVGHNCNTPIGINPTSEEPIHLLYQEAVTLVMENVNVKTPLEDLTKAITMIIHVRGTEGPNVRFPLDWYASMHSSISADAAYIADHVEQVMELLPELHARNTHDWTIIDMLLNHDVQALREGGL